jgi:hypothetical protein
MSFRPVAIVVSVLLCAATLAGTGSVRRPARQVQTGARPGAAPAAPPAGRTVALFPLDELRPGMKGTGYSVFQGDKIEPFPVEILGLLRNAGGPGQHVILARLGEKLESIGVAAGMSGSPVYINGKLVGAISLRVGIFTNEPMAGITPAQLMMEINEQDPSRGPGPLEARHVALPGRVQNLLGLAGEHAPQLYESVRPPLQSPVSAGAPSPETFLTPIETPLVFSGFSESVLKSFAEIFRQMGTTAVQGGAGSAGGSQAVTNARPASALPPGAAVSGVLVSGDLSVAGTGTVTYNDGRRVLAFGHPFFNLGRVDMPMAGAEVVTVLGSSFAPMKIINVTGAVGALRQDRHSGILGVLGRTAAMIPVEATVRSGAGSRTYRFQVFQNPRYTPLLMMITLSNTLQGINEYGDDCTYKVRGSVRLPNLPELRLENMFSGDGVAGMGGQPAPLEAAFWIGERFTRILNNPAFPLPTVSSAKFDFEIIPERRSAGIEQVWADRSEARPGDTVNVTVALRRYRGERLIKQVPVVIPANAARGELRIVLSGSDFVNRTNVNVSRAPGLNEMITAMNRDRGSGRLYISLLQQGATGYIEEKVLPSIPSSVANVIEPTRPGAGSRLTVQMEATLEVDSIPLDCVIGGTQMITLTVK